MLQQPMTKLDVYREVLRGTVRADMALEEVLLVALVLHTHSLALRRDVELDDVRSQPGIHGIVLAPLTRTHVAQLLSSLWPEDDDRGHMDYWLTHYCRTVAYELFEDVPERLREQAIAARDAVMAHDLVERLIEE